MHLPGLHRTLDVTSRASRHLAITERAYCIRVNVCTCLFQGEELLSACSAGSTTDVSTLLEKGADVHFIGKVTRVNTLLYIETLL